MKPSLPRASRVVRPALAGAIATAALLVGPSVIGATVASAQTPAWLADRRYTEGPGFRTGDFELHPGIGAEFGYDSNYFRRSDDEDPVGSLRLRITPHFSISTLGPQRRGDGPPPDVEFRGDLHLTYDEFFPVSGSQAGQDAMADNRNLGGALNLGLKFFPGRPVFGSLHAGLARTISPSNLGDSSASFNRLNPNGGAEIGFAPGGGLFDFRFGYEFQTTVFEQEEFGELTNLNHEFSTRGRWRFLPRSAVFYDTRLGFITYPDAEAKTASHPMRARVGYNGLVTDFFGFMLAGGWGASFYEPVGQQDFDSFIGQAEARFFLTPVPSDDPTGASLSLSQLAVGFNRDFQDSFLGTYYEYDRGYVRFSYFFGGTFLLSVEGGAGAVVFPDIPEPVLASFTDVKADAQLLAEYRFTDFFAMTGTVRYDHYFSDTVISDGVGIDELQWQEFQGYLGARLFY